LAEEENKYLATGHILIPSCCASEADARCCLFSIYESFCKII